MLQPDARRLVVTGAGGVLGWHLCRYFAGKKVPVVGTYRRNRPRIAGVRTEPLELESLTHDFARSLLREAGAVLHTAALTSPDDCEKDPERTEAVNVEGTRLLLEATPPEAPFVFLSTDLVFDGLRGGYREDDPVAPLNLYAESKARAERLVQSRSNGIVVRMAKIYAPGSPFHPCFVTWMRDRFEAGRPVPLFRDQFRTPVYVGDMARALQRLAEGKPRHRLYHMGGAERLSRLEFGRLFAEMFDLDRSLIRPTSFAAAGLVARGADCSLDSSRFCREFDFRFSTVLEGLHSMKIEGS